MVVVRLGDRSNAWIYGCPMISLIVAVENIAIRGAGEESVAAVPNIHCHTFDIGTNVLRQTLAQDVPSPAAVSAAGDARVCRMQRSPGARARLAPPTNSRFGFFGCTKNGST